MNLKTEDNNLNQVTSSLNESITENTNVQSEFGMYDELQNDDMMKQFEDTSYVAPAEVPEKKSVLQTFLAILGVVLFIGIAVWYLVSGIRALFLAPVHSMEEAYTNLIEGEVYEGTITCISPEVGELKHTINFIPAGTEHFYLMVSEDGSTVIPIRASKKWDTLYASGDWLNVSLQERGIVREMDYKVKSELISSVATAFATEGIQVEQAYYLDLNANKMGWLQIFAGLSLLICIVYFGFVAKRIENDGRTFTTVLSGVMLVLGFVSLATFIYLLNMVGL